MQVSVETTQGLERRLTITVPADKVEKEINARLAQLAKTRRIDGFRPGKAPMAMIKQMYGQAVVADAAGGYMTYVDPTTGPDNGKIFMGAAFPAVVKEAKTVLFPIEEKKMRNNADGHVLVVSDYEPGADYVYYWGFAWDRADIKTAEAWNRYMADFAQKVRNPMTVSIR